MAGIWELEYLKKSGIPENFRFSLGEGDTPLVKMLFLDTQIGVKNEYDNPNASFKDRSLAYQIAYHVNKGSKRFAISSSGNAAISAAAYCTKARVELDIYVSGKINPAKLEKIENYLNNKIRLHQSNRPKSDAIKFAKQTGAYDLRGSVDDAALVGYRSLAYELVQQLPEIDALFIPCSSGTSTLGIAEGFTQLKKNVRVYICQTEKINVIAHELDSEFKPSALSLADAIVDRVARRKEQVLELIANSKGGAFVISDALLKETKALLQNTVAAGFSYNSLLGFAALLKAQKAKIKLPFSYPVVLASGT